MDREEKILKIRKSILQNKYPLKYNPFFDSGNCYAYAIGSNFKDVDFMNDFIYNLGNISQIIYPPRTLLEAEKAFILDMQVLGINCRKSSFQETLLANEWKVILFYDDWFEDSYDFHFIRQDKDGSWSYKEGMNGRTWSFNGNPENASELDVVGYYILKVI